MCEVIVLFEGYSKVLDDAAMDANCSCTLIKIKKKQHVIVDTMTAWDKEAILNGNHGTQYNCNMRKILLQICLYLNCFPMQIVKFYITFILNFGILYIDKF